MSIPIPDTGELMVALSLPTEPKFVAEGGFKAVFRIPGPSGNEEALKAVHIPSAAPDDDDALLRREQLVARAKREIVALSQCTSPNIVKLGSVQPVEVSAGGSDYLVYSEEFLPGSSLATLLRRRSQVPFEVLYGVMFSLANLIDELGALGYLHRDIKPDNIIDTGDDNRRYVVLDMGIAYKMHGTELTQGASPPGTLRYMAPELLRPDYKDNMDFRCDLYSAALTVYVLATNAHPFAPNPAAPFATVYRIMNTAPAPLHSLRPDLPLKFCKLIDRCIRKKPALRFSSITAFKSALEESAK